MAPEYMTTKSYDSQSDMFSVGMLLYSLYNHGRTLYECHDNYSAFIKMCDELKMLNTTKLSALPREVCDHIKLALSTKPELRPDAEQFSKVYICKTETRNRYINSEIFLSRYRSSKMLQ